MAFGIADQLGFVGNEPASTKVITETSTSVEVEDTHRLRTDLRQKPSVVLDAGGGFGWQVEGTITYTFWRASGSRAATATGTSRSRAELTLGEVSTERGGPLFGLYYRF